MCCLRCGVVGCALTAWPRESQLPARASAPARARCPLQQRDRQNAGCSISTVTQAGAGDHAGCACRMPTGCWAAAAAAARWAARKPQLLWWCRFAPLRANSSAASKHSFCGMAMASIRPSSLTWLTSGAMPGRRQARRHADTQTQTPTHSSRQQPLQQQQRVLHMLSARASVPSGCRSVHGRVRARVMQQPLMRRRHALGWPQHKRTMVAQPSGVDGVRDKTVRQRVHLHQRCQACGCIRNASRQAQAVRRAVSARADGALSAGAMAAACRRRHTSNSVQQQRQYMHCSTHLPCLRNRTCSSSMHAQAAGSNIRPKHCSAPGWARTYAPRHTRSMHSAAAEQQSSSSPAPRTCICPW